MINVKDLQIIKDDDIIDSSQNLKINQNKEYVSIGDLEEMELTSRNYKIKTKKTKKFWNNALIRIFFYYHCFIFVYISIISLSSKTSKYKC